MQKKEILNLDKTKQAISIAKSFLQTSLTLKDYADVFLFLQEIYLKLNYLNELILETNLYLDKFKDYNGLEKALIIENLIKALIKLKDYDSAYSMISKFKLYSDSENIYKATYYDILILKDKNEKYIDKIRQVLNYNLPLDIKKEYLFEVIKDDIKKLDFISSYKNLVLLENLTKSKYYKLSFYILYMLKDFDKLKEEISRAKKNSDNNFLVYLYLMLIEISLNNFRKASIYEAEANANLKDEDMDLLILFYQNCHILYTNLNNNYLKEDYLKKLNFLLSKKKRLEKSKLKKENIKQDDTFNKGLIKENISRENENILLNVKDETKLISKLLDILSFSFNIKITEKLRDYFRTLLIYSDSFFKAVNQLIYLNDGNLYFYKMERLYDKKININLTEKYLIKNALDYSDVRIYKKEELKKFLDIQTDNQFQDNIEAVITYPLGDFGIYQVCFSTFEQALDYYHGYLFLSKIIYSKLITELNEHNLISDNKFYESIIESQIFKIRYYSKNKTIYSISASNLLGILVDYNFEKFYENLNPEYIYEYKKSISYLMEKENRELQLEYSYKDIMIKEKLISLKKDNDIYVISSFYDVTKSSLKIQTLIDKSNKDLELNIYNLRYLYEEFQRYLTGKKTFIKIEIDLSIKELYSQDQLINYLKEFVAITDNFFTSGDIFRASYNEFIIIIPINDQRAVFNLIAKYNSFLNDYIVNSIKYEKYKVYISTLRYPVQTDTKNIERILKFLEITKQRAKLEPDNNYMDFNFSYYEDEVFEQKVIDYLNDAITNYNLELFLRVYLNLKNTNKSTYYETILAVRNLNIDPEYIKKVAKKRNRLVDYEKMLIKETIKFLKRLYQESDKYINIIISISPETLSSNNFKEFLEDEIKLNDVPYDLIRLKIDGKNIPAFIYDKILKDLIKEGIAIDATDLKFALNYPVNTMHYKLGNFTDKKKCYLKHLNNFLIDYNIGLIITDVRDDSDIERLKELDIKYIHTNKIKDIKAQSLIEIVKNRENE